MRYAVLRLSNTGSDRFRVCYEEGSGRVVDRVVELRAILRSLDDDEKFYIAAHDGETPVNFFFRGVRSVTDITSGKTRDIAEALAAHFVR